MRVIISGGGTGGHIFPALAVADKIKEMIPEAEILFVGANGKMEMDRVPKAGYRIVGLPVRGLQRKLTIENLAFPFRVIGSIVKARKVIGDFGPDVVVGFGGYASGPVLYIGARKGIPAVIQEQNSYAGMTNKILGKKVDKVCVAYSGMDRFFAREKIVFTGNPVRREIFDHDWTKEKASAFFGLEAAKKKILVFGGSLGARTLNQAIAKHFETFKKRQDVQVIWQVGKWYYEEYKTSDVAGLDNVKVMPFIENMAAAYTAADLVVCRAGALTISELCLVGKAAILVPSPNVAEDHQTKNAVAMVNQNAAIMVRDADAREKMVSEMMLLVDDDGQRNTLSREILKQGKPDAAMNIASQIIALAEKKGK